MTTPRPTEPTDVSLTRDLLYVIRYYLGGQRGLWIVATAALIAGAALNWSWLVAAGVLPILLAVAPCAAMCALGLCMNKMAGRSGESESTAIHRAAAPEGDGAAPAARAGGALNAPAYCCAEDGEGAAPAANTPRPQSRKARRSSHA